MRKGFEAISDFIFLDDEVSKADIILVAGGSRKELIDEAIKLYKMGYAEYILISGGSNKKLNYMSEYEYLSNIALNEGIPPEAILKEDKATNTVENAKLSLKVCNDNNLLIEKVILVCKTFHARRAYLSYKLFFSKDIEYIVKPIVDERNITKDNWILNQSKIDIVMGEVEKIGRYFADSIIDLS